jgi:hypothetical protein
MALIQDLRVGMKVQVRENHRYYPFKFGEVLATSWSDDQVLVILEGTIIKEWFHTIQLKIIKDKGETKMTQKTKVKQEVTPQKYVLIDDDDHTRVFTDVSAHGICKVSNDDWGFEVKETLNRLSSGKMKLFKIEEVKLEVTEPSIKIVG